jgi:formamidopyrimidine-DNA glycosylase
LPELPDVEVFRRYLNSTALHKTIEGVAVKDAGVLRSISGTKLKKQLKGRSLESTKRRGKHMLARLDDGHWLTFHFGMTGYLEYFKTSSGDREYDRVVVDFTNGYHLAFVNRRKLGRMGIVEDADRFFAARSLGPDALGLNIGDFEEVMKGRRGSIKPALMDQSLIAGLGNIYSDEVLYQAGVDPRTPVRKLKQEAIRRLFKRMKHVLSISIERKANPDDMPRTWLLLHREKGAPCPRCRGEVEKIRLSGRSTYLCPACQSRSGR